MTKPRMTPIQWDSGAAHSAARALRNAANRLRDSVYDRRAWAEQAQDRWRGVFRDQFDDNLDQLLGQASSLADEYDAKASEIERRTAEAEQAERERQAAVLRWQEEQRRKKKKKD